MSEETQAAERLARIEAALHTVAEKQTELGAYLPMIVSELRKRDDDLQSQINSRAMFCAAQSPVYQNLVESVEDHDKRIKALEALMPALRFVMWVGGIFGLAILGLVWAIITGEVQVIFP